MEVMILGEDKNENTFTFNNKNLEVVQEYKYLWVIVNSVKRLHGNILKNMRSYSADKAVKCSLSVSQKCNKSVGILLRQKVVYTYLTHILLLC